MTSNRSDRRLLLGVAPIVVAGLVVLALAATLAGPAVATVAVCGVAITLAIFATAEAASWLSGIDRPLERMLLAMGVRGFLAAAAVIAAIKTTGVEPRVIALVALPLYLSLVAGEIATAMQLGAAGMNNQLGAAEGKE